MRGGGEEARPGAREGYEGGRTFAPPRRELGGGGEGEGERDGVRGGGEEGSRYGNASSSSLCLRRSLYRSARASRRTGFLSR